MKSNFHSLLIGPHKTRQKLIFFWSFIIQVSLASLPNLDGWKSWTSWFWKLMEALNLTCPYCTNLHLRMLNSSNQSLDQSHLKISLSVAVVDHKVKILLYIVLCHLQKSLQIHFTTSGRSFIKIMKSTGPNTLPWGMPDNTGFQFARQYWFPIWKCST